VCVCVCVRACVDEEKGAVMGGCKRDEWTAMELQGDGIMRTREKGFILLLLL
jgi:hypothetical protein